MVRSKMFEKQTQEVAWLTSHRHRPEKKRCTMMEMKMKAMVLLYDSLYERMMQHELELTPQSLPLSCQIFSASSAPL